MTGPQDFALDRKLFNQTLYSKLRDFWFQGLGDDATSGNEVVQRRWYGVGASDKERRAFDDEARSAFGPALESITPSKLGLPPFSSYDNELDQANTLAAPFLREVEEAQSKSHRAGADTLLSLTLLLDQMARNIYRDHDGLRLVYNHYDRLAFALIHSSMRMIPDPIQEDSYKHRPVLKSWFFMPLMHSEHMPSHELFVELEQRMLREVESHGDQEATDYVLSSLNFEEKHQGPLRRFGRYPHRNECLGRRNTADETEYLKTADTFGVKQNQKAEKSEL